MQAPATVLYVEDDPDDVFFLRRAMRSQNIDCTLQTVSNARAAKSYLTGKAPYDNREQFPIPSLIVTDLTVAGEYGSSLELISWIRSFPELAAIPMLCATGNDHSRTLEEFSRAGVVCHQKNSQMTEIAAAIKAGLEEIASG